MSNNVIRNSIVFYTDGSSLGKPKKKGKRAAGCGVFFAPNDPRNYGGALGPDPQTNQRAELAAIWEGLTRIKFTDHATIYTDSEYAMFAPTSRYYTQKRNSWKTPEGKPVPNIDLIEPIFQLLVLRKASGATTDLRWLKGHSGYPGNEAADRLAAEGAEREWLRRYGTPYCEEPASMSSAWNPLPRGKKLIKLPNGEEALVPIDDVDLKRKEAKQQKNLKNIQTAERNRKTARRIRPKSKAERLALKRAIEEHKAMYPKPRLMSDGPPHRPTDAPAQRRADVPARRQTNAPAQHQAGVPARRQTNAPAQHQAGVPARRQMNPPAQRPLQPSPQQPMQVSTAQPTLGIGQEAQPGRQAEGARRVQFGVDEVRSYTPGEVIDAFRAASDAGDVISVSSTEV